MKSITTIKPYTHDVLKSDIKQLISAYPFLKETVIGRSVLGKELFCLQFGEGDKKIFINGAHHGTEWITSILIMRMTEKLCMLYNEKINPQNTDIMSLFKSVSLFACPMVNPDGVGLSVKGLTDDIPSVTKTKLISFNNNSKDFIGKWQANINGVDLNHNYNAAFDKGKFYESRLNIFSPCASRFSGMSYESEPESKAMVKFTDFIRPCVAVAYHSQGEIIYSDFEGKASPQAKILANELSDISGYKLDKTDGMASFSGYKDWVISKYGIPAFTFEIGLGKNPLPLAQFDKIFETNFRMLLHILSRNIV